jgi:hypothetical protein
VSTIRRIVTCTIIVTLFLTGVAFGQTVGGTITGTVKDPQGSLIPTAAIKLTNVETGVSNSQITNDSGISTLCRMFQQAIQRQSLPKYLSTDNDPLYRFHQWQANLRVLDVVEIKTVPFVPLSHPFVERLVGTLRRECLDRTLFWTTADLEAKLLAFRDYFNGYRSHAGLQGRPPEPGVGEREKPVSLMLYRWRKHCRGLYQTPIAA